MLNFRGIFKMEREDGTVFDCKIPAFALDSKQNSTASSGSKPSGGGGGDDVGGGGGKPSL